MKKKTIEHAAGVLKEIKAELNSGVIKTHEIPVLCNMETGRERTGDTDGYGVCEKTNEECRCSDKCHLTHGKP